MVRRMGCRGRLRPGGDSALGLVVPFLNRRTGWMWRRSGARDAGVDSGREGTRRWSRWFRPSNAGRAGCGDGPAHSMPGPARHRGRPAPAPCRLRPQSPDGPEVAMVRRMGCRGRLRSGGRAALGPVVPSLKCRTGWMWRWSGAWGAGVGSGRAGTRRWSRWFRPSNVGRAGSGDGSAHGMPCPAPRIGGHPAPAPCRLRTQTPDGLVVRHALRCVLARPRACPARPRVCGTYDLEVC